jgi:cytochrome c556
MKHLSAIVIFFALCALVTGQAFSEDEPTPEERAYKFRTSLFQTFGWKYGQLIAAKQRSDEEGFIKHAGDLVYLSTLLEEGFQIENSLPEGTRAKPEIWQDFAKFEDKAKNLNTQAKTLTEAGAMADFDPRDFGSKACGTCHRDFRIKEKE